MSEPFDQNKAVFIGRRALHESARWESYAARHGLANTCRMMFNTNEFVFVN